MTLTTDQIEQVIDDCRKGAAMRGLFNKWIVEEMASELLRCRGRLAELSAVANREAQPVALNGWRVTVIRTGDRQGVASISGPGVFCMEVPVEYSMLDFMEALTAPPAPAVPPEATPENIENLLADITLFFTAGSLSHGGSVMFAEVWNACRAAMLTQPVSQRYTLPEGFKLVPVESTDAWAERYCELTNKHPDGGLTTYIGDGAVTITFREKSKREIDAMLAAAPTQGKENE
ncbi:hypothetical protein [Serratia marcescens]|uniref:hypothetical protein n=1 Tax=Serratia marcescens TaxID=615 RepID=UPI001F097491|nr:hypothetical protein [Serratia marcescens]